MKLYHYAPKVNTVKEQGLLSISKGPRDLRAYAHRAGSENRDEIMAWLDKTFSGASSTGKSTLCKYCSDIYNEPCAF